MMKMNDFDDCVVGIVERYGMDPVICYDRDMVLAKLASEEGVTMEDAVEWYEFNMIGAWVGEGTPAFLTVKTMEEIEEEL